MLSAVVLHVADAVQLFTVPGCLAPVTWPTYCAMLVWVVSASVQSTNDAQRCPSECRYGIAVPKPTPPTVAVNRVSQVRFSNANTITDRYWLGWGALIPQV